MRKEKLEFQMMWYPRPASVSLDVRSDILRVLTRDSIFSLMGCGGVLRQTVPLC